VAEDDRAEEERRSRTAEFESRARSMGITNEQLIAQKVAIWEGMWDAQKNNDSIRVSIRYSFLGCTSSGAAAGGMEGLNGSLVPRRDSLGCRNQPRLVISSPKLGSSPDVPYR